MIDVDIVIHTAALHGIHVSQGVSKENFIQTNINGTQNLLEVCSIEKIQKFIYTSTTSVYGADYSNPEKAIWVDEDLELIPKNIYAVTKIAAEGLCQVYHKEDLIKSTILRVSRFFEAPLNEIADLRMYRGLDVRDMALAHVLAMNKDFENCEAFNISGPNPFSQDDLVDLKLHSDKVIEQHFPKAKNVYDRNNWILPKSIDRVYVVTKAEKLLGFNPTYNFSKFLDDPYDVQF